MPYGYPEGYQRANTPTAAHLDGAAGGYVSHDRYGHTGDLHRHDGPLEEEIEPLDLGPRHESKSSASAYAVRALALLCACSLSIGSHYASYILGPLKSRLAREMGTNNTEFSLLIAAFSLNSTWTPLVGGVMANRLGTTFTSILATGVIFLGQLLLLVGNIIGSVRLMVFGMFVFGLGVSPLAVVQETIIVRFFKTHGLGISMALGLVAGKAASFVSARTSYPLSERFGPHAPFYAATSLTAVSFCVNLIYLSASKWFVHGAGAELEASDLHTEARNQAAEHIRTGSIQSLSEAEALKEVAKKRMVNLRDVTKLGDVFWAYIALNVLCGAIWSPFTHLAPNIIERRYNLTESDASTKAAYILVGSVILYPVTGFIVDIVKGRGIVLHLFTASSVLTLGTFVWLALPPSVTWTPIPAIISFAAGYGFAPLLLVVLVPQIVPSKYVSTTLGAHKALEQTGTTIFQTLAGVALDIKTKTSAPESGKPAPQGDKDVERLLIAQILLNIAQLGGVAALSYLHRRQKRAAARRMSATLPLIVEDEEDGTVPDSAKEPILGDAWQEDGHVPGTGTIRGPLPSTSSPEQSIPLLRSASRASIAHSTHRFSGGVADRSVTLNKSEIKRGEVFAVLSVLMVLLAWVLFMGTAWLRLRSKEERGQSASLH